MLDVQNQFSLLLLSIYRNITETSQKHRRNVLETSQKHHRNTSQKCPRNIIEIS